MTVRILVADDQELVRAGFAAVLGTQPDFEVVAEAATGREAVNQARTHRPDVVLMDVRMPDLDGIAATAEICRDARTRSRVLILTTFDLDEYVLAAGRCQRLPAQGRSPRQPVRRGTNRRGRRRTARTKRDQATDRTSPETGRALP